MSYAVPATGCPVQIALIALDDDYPMDNTLYI